MLYSHRNSTGMNGSATSCNVTAMAAATMLQRVSQAKKMDSNVLSPTSGVNPKKIPMATPPAMAFGVSRIASSFSECSLNHLRRFIGSGNPVQYYQGVPGCTANFIDSASALSLTAPSSSCRMLVGILPGVCLAPQQRFAQGRGLPPARRARAPLLRDGGQAASLSAISWELAFP